MGKYSTTLATLTQRLSQTFDDLVLGVVDTSASNSTTVAYDTIRVESDDYFNGWDLHVYAGTNIGSTRVVSDFAATTDLITVAPAMGSAFDNTSYYQMHKLFKYDQYVSAINRAIDSAKHEFLITKKDDTAVQNRLSNYDFESVTTGWTASGTGASIAISSTVAEHGTYSLRLTVGTNTSMAYQSLSNPRTYAGKSMRLQCWVYAADASKVYLSIYDGTTTTSSDYHSGDSTWELLEVSADIGEEPTEVTVKLSSLTGPTYAYFDMPIFKEANYYELSIPTTNSYHYISEIWYESTPESTNYDCKVPPRDWWIIKDATTPIIRFDTTYSYATGFRIIGQTIQDLLTTDAGVCYMPPEFIIQQARVYLLAQRPEYEGLLKSAMTLAQIERRELSTPLLPNSKALYEV